MGALGLGAIGLGGALAGCSSGGSPSTSTTSAGAVRKGGSATVAWVGNGTTETVNPEQAVAEVDEGRAQALFDTFVRFLPDQTLGYALAESMEPNAKATQWIMHLRQGVEWHDGAPFVADDAIYTLRYYGQPTSTAPLASTYIDLKNLKALDDHTVQIPLKSANADLPNFMQLIYVVKNGTTSFKHPIGTGPFKFVSGSRPASRASSSRTRITGSRASRIWTRSRWSRSPTRPHGFNALLGGQIDAMGSR